MIPMIDAKRNELDQLCQRFSVARLEVFGSASEHDQDVEARDLDFLVTFHPGVAMGPADQYFGLLDALKQLFDRPIDLVCADAMSNPYFIRQVNRSRTTLYAA